MLAPRPERADRRTALPEALGAPSQQHFARLASRVEHVSSTERRARLPAQLPAAERSVRLPEARA